VARASVYTDKLHREINEKKNLKSNYQREKSDSEVHGVSLVYFCKE